MISAKGISTSSAWSNLFAKLNGVWHEKSVWIYGFIVIMHWVEHLTQACQIFILGWARPDSRGFLGLYYPWLIKSEVLHWGYAAFMLAGLVALRPAFYGRARTWWNISLAIQAWHFFEHSLLQWQAISGGNFFGSAVPTSILQLWIPRVELHLIYNAIVFIPMIIAMYYHRYPPAGELEKYNPQCSCAAKAT
jgi:hypothetical protein